MNGNEQRIPRATEGRKLPIRLDRIDLAILKALRENGRMTYQALSERVGLSARPCLDRVRRLERAGVITGYTVQIDPAAFGVELVALAEIALRDPSASTRRHLERLLCTEAAVQELQVVTGEYDYIARIAAPTLLDYEVFTDALLSDPANGIARIHTTFVLKTLKAYEGPTLPDSLEALE
ncbi:Lrp/AsnC family transcriptional regulator [Microvirga massiliensis]|uniref:Lrp/AsnC family transcriptional regulator n=1 Tax=Microvirga massiliensis TaxID=1033741 RepID=UPI00062BB9F6|nr:Lrp/AsnC family transcriptional regulator [Microvirga massiliensis]